MISLAGNGFRSRQVHRTNSVGTNLFATHVTQLRHKEQTVAKWIRKPYDALLFSSEAVFILIGTIHKYLNMIH
jgi:hypothetical protein